MATSRDRERDRQMGAGQMEVQTAVYKVDGPQGHTVRHREIWYYFAVTLNGA